MTDSSFCTAEEYLIASPDDVQAWISYAQMVKRPMEHETKVGRLQPGIASRNDVDVSRESVFRSRRVLHRAIEHELGRSRPGTVGHVPNESLARLMQALGLLELTHGNEAWGSALLEFCVNEQRALRPVLLWQRVQDARKRQLASGGVFRLRKMRENVGRIYCLRNGEPPSGPRARR